LLQKTNRCTAADPAAQSDPLPSYCRSASRAIFPNQHHYLEGVKALWIEQKNPYWVWVAIKTSIRNDEPFPDWVCEYLEQVADQLLARGAASGDFARKLPQILGFRSKSGPKHPLKIGRRMLRNEEYAMKFAKHILMGKTPKNARNDAANESDRYWREADDKTLQAALREHFKLRRAPSGNRVWQPIVRTAGRADLRRVARA
jgi:hypothetical protein